MPLLTPPPSLIYRSRRLTPRHEAVEATRRAIESLRRFRLARSRRRRLITPYSASAADVGSVYRRSAILTLSAELLACLMRILYISAARYFCQITPV